MDWQPIADTLQTIDFHCPAVITESETAVDDITHVEVSVIDGSMELSDSAVKVSSVNFEVYVKLGGAAFVVNCSSETAHARNIARVVALEMLDRGVAIDEQAFTRALADALEAM